MVNMFDLAALCSHFGAKVRHMGTAANRFNAAVGRQIRAEISAGGSSIAAMSRAIGIARSTLDNYVNGERDIPVPAVYAVCAQVGIDPHLLVKRAEERFASEEARGTEAGQ